MIHPDRIRQLQEGTPGKSAVVYWMSRDQRSRDNWALLFAQQRAVQRKKPLIVVFCLVPDFLDAAWRQYHFMIKGLQGVEAELRKKSIPFVLLAGNPKQELPRFIHRHDVSELILDFDPLRLKKDWKKDVLDAVRVPVSEVDARNVVPCWKASDKQEYAARTIRPKIQRQLDEFLDDIPELKKHPHEAKLDLHPVDWEEVAGSLKVDRSVQPVDWLVPGEDAARKVLGTFLADRLKHYDEAGNDPTRQVQSDLSPYLHFGQISAQRVANEVLSFKTRTDYKDAFLEQLIVRRELADNFCHYNPAYDSTDCFPDWARKTLEKHRSDPREHVYSLEEFEQAKTHDDLWNAAQMEMVKRGKMHGYMRMYWAKKILEWTRSAEEAMHIAVTLNDRWELDGRDSNGYTGIAWSIGGIHDRGWKERPIFGKIRYMSASGCRRKFDVDAYIEQQLGDGRP